MSSAATPEEGTGMTRDLRAALDVEAGGEAHSADTDTGGEE